MQTPQKSLFLSTYSQSIAVAISTTLLLQANKLYLYPNGTLGDDGDFVATKLKVPPSIQ